MTEDKTVTVRATFATREAVELAVEHLVQQHGIPRPDVFIQSTNDENTAGTEAAGGDVSPGVESSDDAALEGNIEVSVDVTESQLEEVEAALREVGAVDVSKG